MYFVKFCVVYFELKKAAYDVEVQTKVLFKKWAIPGLFLVTNKNNNFYKNVHQLYCAGV